MARGTEVVTIVRSDNIAGMMGRTGQVGRWMGRRAQEITLKSRLEVKSRSGVLAASIHSTGVHHDLPFHAHFDTRAEAHYALYVHEGTIMVAPITSNRPVDRNGRVPGKMSVPRYKGAGFDRVYREKVAGQRANAFLTKGMAKALKNEVGSGVLLLPR